MLLVKNFVVYYLVRSRSSLPLSGVLVLWCVPPALENLTQLYLGLLWHVGLVQNWAALPNNLV